MGEAYFRLTYGYLHAVLQLPPEVDILEVASRRDGDIFRNYPEVFVRISHPAFPDTGEGQQIPEIIPTIDHVPIPIIDNRTPARTVWDWGLSDEEMVEETPTLAPEQEPSHDPS